MYSDRVTQLDNFEDVIGVLEELIEDQGITLASVGKKSITIPWYLKGILTLLIGRRISILKTGIREKQYLVLIRDEENKALRFMTENGWKSELNSFNSVLNSDSSCVVNWRTIIEA